MPTIAITGHRPEDIDDLGWVEENLRKVLKDLNPSKLYQGMAAGVDLMSACIAYNLGIPYIAARPWKTHEPRVEDREIYKLALEKAFEVVDVTEVSYYLGPQLYHARNKYMVDHADIVVAVWNGSNKGGTASCVKYALKQNKPLIHINPETQTITQIAETPALF